MNNVVFKAEVKALDSSLTEKIQLSKFTLVYAKGFPMEERRLCLRI